MREKSQEHTFPSYLFFLFVFYMFPLFILMGGEGLAMSWIQHGHPVEPVRERGGPASRTHAGHDISRKCITVGHS